MRRSRTSSDTLKLQRGLGKWVDADVLVVRNFGDLLTRDHVFGWESAEAINGAVLKLPPTSGLSLHRRNDKGAGARPTREV
jgi:hypothetical protein